MTVSAVRPRTTRLETTTRVTATRLDWVLMLAAGCPAGVGCGAGVVGHLDA